MKLWSRTKKEPIKVFKSRNIFNATFSKDEKKILTWSWYGDIKLWSIYKSKALKKFEQGSTVGGAIFINNEKQILSWSGGGKDFLPSSVKLWSLDGNEPQKIFDEFAIDSMILSKDEKKILFGGLATPLNLWNFDTMKILKIIPNSKETNNAVFSKNEQEIFYWDDKGQIKVFNLYEKSKVDKQDYLLKTQVETGVYLNLARRVKALTKKEWEAKKMKYEKTLKESEKI